MKVTSTVIDEIDYVGNQLFVKFKNNKTYKYEWCSPSQYRDFIQSKSKWTFLKTKLNKLKYNLYK